MTDLPLSSMMQSARPGPITIDQLVAEPYPDQRRIRVKVDLSGEGQRPNLEFICSDESGYELARSVIVEVLTAHTEFTMHLKGNPPQGPILMSCRAYFEESDFTDIMQITFSL